ncbi:MAG: PHP domain-containing protein [Chloroflexi bacterium]|nr:PHP domain-containing protein [Chloroflexota bacterium]
MDSNLTPQELLDEAYRIGLQGVCLTEHSGPWERYEFSSFARQQSNTLIINAIEVESDAGHITVFGLDGYVSGIRDPKTLRKVADQAGAYIVLAHPFRNLLHKPPYNATNLLYRGWNPLPTTVEEAMQHPIFELVDAIEVANGATIDAENYFAWEVAKRLGKPMVGGSDAHSTNGLGRCVTIFEGAIATPGEFLEALHAGRFYPATGLLVGQLEEVGQR